MNYRQFNSIYSYSKLCGFNYVWQVRSFIKIYEDCSNPTEEALEALKSLFWDKVKNEMEEN